MNPCSICYKQTNKKCKKCFTIYYCSKVCQKKDWKQHKKICKIKEYIKTYIPPQNLQQLMFRKACASMFGSNQCGICGDTENLCQINFQNNNSLKICRDCKRIQQRL